MDVADLELGLHRLDEQEYSAELRFNRPNSDAEKRTGQMPICFDLAALREVASQPDRYGQMLTDQLFASRELRDAFLDARTVADELGAALRLHLTIGRSAPDLHALRWETLRDPRTNLPLATDDRLFFSRYLTSAEWRPVRLKSNSILRALVIVASPTDLAEYQLSPIDVPAELDRARAGLGPRPVICLPGDGGRPTLKNLLAVLDQEDPVDLLYLVCHGAAGGGQQILFLENEQGLTDRVPTEKLVECLRELSNRPRLALLISCQSAGAGTGNVLTALGPRLVEIGVPAVIAMQSSLSMETAARFIPAFFGKLESDGKIDLAMNYARRAIRERPDAWVPVLFMRLKSGRLWYRPGFSDNKDSQATFLVHVRNIERKHCTPILGPILVEPLLGSLREIALRWADQYHYPMAPHERESLPQVAQYLSTGYGPNFPLDELADSLKSHLAPSLPPEQAGADLTLNQTIDAAARSRCSTWQCDPHRALAQLPLPIYITANLDSLLEAALRDEGKDPQTILCPWNDYIEQLETIADREPGYLPGPQRPMVFHLFGSWDYPESVVLTEDQYFDYLTGVASNKDLIPELVREALADSSLLFLGFQTEEWSFRVIFRSLLAQRGSGRIRRYVHAAAQIEPEDGRILEPVRARRYLEKYFTKGADIDIYWGSAEEFMVELMKYWRQLHR